MNITRAICIDMQFQREPLEQSKRLLYGITKAANYLGLTAARTLRHEFFAPGQSADRKVRCS